MNMHNHDAAPPGDDNQEKPRPPMREVTHKIREWRKFRALTTEQLAAKSIVKGKSLTASLISQLEIGRCSFTQNSLEAIAAALDVSPAFLLEVGPDDVAEWPLRIMRQDERWQLLRPDQRHRAEAYFRESSAMLFDLMLKHWPTMELDET